MAPAINRGELRLHVKTLVPPDLPVATMVSAASQVFQPANIRINLVSVETLNLTVPDIPVGNCDGKNLTPEQTALFTNRNNTLPNDAIAYVARSLIPPMEGCSACPPGLPSTIISQSATTWALAHELGHLLGLDHVDDDDNLMTGSGAENITNPPPDLTADQIATLRASPLVQFDGSPAETAVRRKLKKRQIVAKGRARPKRKSKL